MAVMPGVDYRPISYSGVPKMARYDIVCIHTIVGNDPATAAHFSTRGDGYTTQSRDTAYQSAANYQGNPRIIAVENDDHGSEFGSWSGSDVPAFTDAQCESIAHVCAWAHKTHGIPLVACPDSKPGSRGIAYHRQGIDGNFAGYAYGGRVPGGELWSTSYGKVCPGDRRISQVLNVIIPRARVIAGLDQGDPDMAYGPDQDKRDWSTAERLRDLIKALGTVEQGVTTGEPIYLTRHIYEMMGNLRALMTLAPSNDVMNNSPTLPWFPPAGQPLPLVELMQEMAAGIAALNGRPVLPAGGLSDEDVTRIATETADILDARARDGDPATGPTT